MRIVDLTFDDRRIEMTALRNAVGVNICSVRAEDLPSDCLSSQFFQLLTDAQLEACQCELAAYTTALNEVEDISVNGGPPYECSPVECALPIPTLNQWRMLIMAGVLGLIAVIGLTVVRRSTGKP